VQDEDELGCGPTEEGNAPGIKGMDSESSEEEEEEKYQKDDQDQDIESINLNDDGSPNEKPQFKVKKDKKIKKSYVGKL
jgi:hypothetical protein|tara:strand:+ start:334 stop:570 length:237 start_codon:yes stop_codon:yes gene_type:complete